MKILMILITVFVSGTVVHGHERYEPAACPDLCYTLWFDRDKPSGFGDYETLINLLAENPGFICKNPLFIEAQTISGNDASGTGQVFAYYDTTNGFGCVNAQQPQGSKCLDYKVRFTCPCSDLRTDIDTCET